MSTKHRQYFWQKRIILLKGVDILTETFILSLSSTIQRIVRHNRLQVGS